MSKSFVDRRDCLLTGLFYLGIAITGGAGFMGVRPLLIADGDPAGTLQNLLANPGTARVRVALELSLAIFQSLASLWFARLFRGTDSYLATALGTFGMVNAVVVLASAALLGSALDVGLGVAGSPPELSHLMFTISDHLWRAGGMFFGLWLIPMGLLTWRANLGPAALGWILVLGGIGYVLNTFVIVLLPQAGFWVIVLPIAATVGEFWMIGLLLWRGARPVSVQA
jgi:hypothetical protein